MNESLYLPDDQLRDICMAKHKAGSTKISLQLNLKKVQQQFVDTPLTSSIVNSWFDLYIISEPNNNSTAKVGIHSTFSQTLIQKFVPGSLCGFIIN